MHTDDHDAAAVHLAAALSYHERTKHDYARPARSPGYLDWSNQPDPFRRYASAPLTLLEQPTGQPTATYEELYHPGAVAAQPFDLASVSALLYHSLALSAWKSFEGSRWPLRVNPSSGNLHPTEGYVFLPGLTGLDPTSGTESCGTPGLFHYAPKEHGLERRARFDDSGWSQLIAGLPSDSFIVGLSSVPWRESWKYGERAYRYCQHDVGHALAALRYAAALQGWTLQVLPNVPHPTQAALLGLDRAAEFDSEEPEHPDLLAVVLTNPAQAETASDISAWKPSAQAVRQLLQASWFGRANTLSPSHAHWPVIAEVGSACTRTLHSPTIAAPQASPSQPLPLDSSADVPNASTILRQRRSATAFNGTTGMTRDGFYELLSRLLPLRSAVPWDAQTWPTFVHLGLYVHRVAELPPGRYALVREPSQLDALRASMDSSFSWTRPEGCPDSLPLYALNEDNVTRQATGVSCGQEIAGDSVFSLGMLAQFDKPLQRYGAALYPMLFWETGMIGQVLYLEAEAIGLRGTGIGCFFDNPVHRDFGLQDQSFQSLYHFTIGGAVNDERLSTEAAYGDSHEST
ncbi:MAG: SagB-type dehydrogenase family enzyme [Pseudohongiellaceae bacterium]|jgi:SagB-type dehydrogenase family enzyme